MKLRKVLQPHEFRVIKIDRKAILGLMWEILDVNSYKYFKIPYKNYFKKRKYVQFFFDAENTEIILAAHCCTNTVSRDSIIEYIRKYSVETTESLLSKPDGREYYHSIHIPTTDFVNQSITNTKRSVPHTSILEKLFKRLGVSVLPLKNQEIRIIRLSLQAISELLWEHFVETGDEVMDIPEETDDFQAFYHMYIEGKLETLTLYVMNFNEVSDKVLAENKAYFDQNIHFTTDSYSTSEKIYISVIRKDGSLS